MESTDVWTFDVALSFAGADRSKALAIAEALRARNLKVFYDEWFKAQIWGKDLILTLRDIYLNQAHLCVPLISQAYVKGTYPKHELNVILKREALGPGGHILPVRIDRSRAPGLSRTIAFVEYATEGPAGIAGLIAERLRSVAPANERVANLPAPRTSGQGTRHVLSTHSRRVPPEVFSVSVPELVELALRTDLNASAMQRVRLAKEMLIYLNWQRSAGLGTAYGAWRDGDTVYLSTLPSLDAPQRTFEFSLSADRKALDLTSEWATDDPRYASIKHWEWQPAVEGLTADRSVPDLDREVVLLLLERKGAQFGFPIVPVGDSPEKLCEWLPQEPPADYLDWGRDPRLVPEGVGPWYLLEHQPTEVGVLVFTLQGRWSASAFLAMNEALRVLLPTRHRLRTVAQGAIRVCIFLSLTQASDGQDGYPSLEETSNIWPAIRRAYATVARMVAANRQLPFDPPTPASALPALSRGQASLFTEAEAALGDAEYPKFVDRTNLQFDKASWIKMHQSASAYQTGLTSSTPPRFSFGDVVTLQDLRRYITASEGEPGEND